MQGCGTQVSPVSCALCLPYISLSQLVVDEVQFYVRPVANPTLTPFCTELTGITQAVVDDGILFADALEQYCKWLESKVRVCVQVHYCCVYVHADYTVGCFAVHGLCSGLCRRQLHCDLWRLGLAADAAAAGVCVCEQAAWLHTLSAPCALDPLTMSVPSHTITVSPSYAYDPTPGLPANVDQH